MEKHVTFSKEQITHIRQVLAKNIGTVETLHTIPPEYINDLLPVFSGQVCRELLSCINLLESERQYESGL